jgi:hypothetical protein
MFDLTPLISQIKEFNQTLILQELQEIRKFLNAINSEAKSRNT